MNENTILRPVTMKDVDILLEWRNDKATREASHNTSLVAKEDHIAWLEKSLKNTNRRLFIAEENDCPVGTARADFDDGVWELSWTVAPKSRGRGVAKRMVFMLAQQFVEPIRAEVKKDNKSSARIAEYVGMVLSREVDGVLHYSRDALSNG